MALIGLVCILLVMVPNVVGQPQYYFEVGAVGDSGSTGNIGVQGEIRTHIFKMALGDQDQFYIREIFDGGSSIVFGYTIGMSSAFAPEVGQTTAYDARWFWGAKVFSMIPVGDYGWVGKEGSAGLNGTWHRYSIVHDSTSHKWVFDFDGVQVDYAYYAGVVPINITETTESVYFAAERISWTQRDSILGPVEFLNLSYLKEDGWHSVNSLRARVVCLVNNDPKTPCNFDSPYGMLEVGANHVLAGSGLPKPASGDILWTMNPMDYLTPYLTPIAIIALMIVFVYSVIRRKVLIIPASKPTSAKPVQRFHIRSRFFTTHLKRTVGVEDLTLPGK